MRHPQRCVYCFLFLWLQRGPHRGQIARRAVDPTAPIRTFLLLAGSTVDYSMWPMCYLDGGWSGIGSGWIEVSSCSGHVPQMGPIGGHA
jgi:hypothetical protein